MPTGAPATQKIIDAWTGVKDEWIVRRNKAHDVGQQWEVVHADGVNMKTVGRYASEREAHAKADDLENLARAAAVQKMISDWNV